MATMIEYEVKLRIVINDDCSYHPKDWDWADFLRLETDEGEEVEVLSIEEIDRSESDEDDEASCPFQDGDRVKVIATTRELLDSPTHVHEPVHAARVAGHKGRVIDTDPGCAPEVQVELDNGEELWVCEEQLAKVED